MAEQVAARISWAQVLHLPWLSVQGCPIQLKFPTSHPRLHLPPLGELSRATVGIDARGQRPSWHLEGLAVTDETSGRRWCFPGNGLAGAGMGLTGSILLPPLLPLLLGDEQTLSYGS
jgi:hypothetical protein